MNTGRFHLLTVVVASLATGKSCRASLNEHCVLSANGNQSLKKFLRNANNFNDIIYKEKRRVTGVKFGCHRTPNRFAVKNLLNNNIEVIWQQKQ